MRSLFRFFAGRITTQPKRVERDLEPFEYLNGGIVRFEMKTMHRLEEIQTRAAYLREQQEALAAEACELLNCDPDGDELDTDYATEIVYMGTPVGTALDSIIQYREMRGKKCQ